jgi:hypothetical protein
MVANAYDKKQRRINEHIRNNDIHIANTPEAITRNQLRSYNVNFRKDGKEYAMRIDAGNYLDAKLRMIRQLDIDHTSILSVV